MKSSIIDCQTLQDMKKKVKCPTCTSGWCKNHLFLLKPLNSNLFFRKEQKIRVCPKLNKEKQSFERIVPTIHEDGKYYTPFFVLDDERKYYTENDQRVRRNHLIKVQQDNSGKSQLVCNQFQLGQKLKLFSFTFFYDLSQFQSMQERKIIAQYVDQTMKIILNIQKVCHISV